MNDLLLRVLRGWLGGAAVSLGCCDWPCMKYQYIELGITTKSGCANLLTWFICRYFGVNLYCRISTNTWVATLFCSTSRPVWCMAVWWRVIVLQKRTIVYRRRCCGCRESPILSYCEPMTGSRALSVLAQVTQDAAALLVPHRLYVRTVFVWTSKVHGVHN